MSMYSASDSSSIFSIGTFTSTTSTVSGLGSLSGKAIKRVGSAVVDGVDAILIRRRLAQIEDSLGPTSDVITKTGVVKSLYSDLLELSRPVYSLSTRTRAFRVIMSKIGGLDFEDLARAVADWPMMESYDLLITVMTSLFQDSSNSEAQSLNNIHESEGSARLDILFAAGDDAYESQVPFALAENVPRRSFAIAFLLFIAFSVALNSDPSFSRVVLETGLLSFIVNLYPDFSKETTLRQQSYFFPAHLTLHTLLERLDPEVDSLFISQLKNMLDENFHLSSDTLTSIRLAVSQQDLLVMKFLEKPDILFLGPGETGNTTLVTQIVKTCLNGPKQFCSDRDRAEYNIPVLRNVSVSLNRLLDIIISRGWNLKSFENVLVVLLNVLDNHHFDVGNIPRMQEFVEIFRFLPLYRHLYLPAHVDHFQPRILKQYSPSDRDGIQCFIKTTTGIHPTPINLKGSIVSAGGQLPEQQDAVNGLPRAGLVIYVASLSNYDEICAETPSEKYMDTIEMLVGSGYFADVPLVLLLNKTEVFTLELRRVYSMKRAISFLTVPEETVSTMRPVDTSRISFFPKHHQILASTSRRP
ncbi:hypothetical protein F5878DRAFT_605005 [Lentinula raphanica]|uniref:G-alpha-domain-containing protein n=1 Tax=Lentinula raphanica TaxID=153919 RepID=A0AA38ULT1_9AGAR|nr:hypothetical protein F5878DRAFT_605005 [Lentinula raphanica]